MEDLLCYVLFDLLFDFSMHIHSWFIVLFDALSLLFAHLRGLLLFDPCLPFLCWLFAAIWWKIGTIFSFVGENVRMGWFGYILFWLGLSWLRSGCLIPVWFVVSLPVKQGRFGAMIMKPQVAVGLGARKKKMRQKLRMRECKIKKKKTNCGWGIPDDPS